jgi:multidrug efflux pump subunit AcrB
MTMRGNTTALTPYQGSVTVKLKEDRKEATADVMADMKKELSRIPGIRPRVNQYDVVSNIISGGNQNVEVDIFGEDLSTLSKLSKEVMGRVREIRGLENVDVNWQEAMPEFQWRIDRRKALQMGVTFKMWLIQLIQQQMAPSPVTIRKKASSIQFWFKCRNRLERRRLK